MPSLSPPIDTQPGPPTLIDALLAEEREWTAADRFSNWHDRNGHEPAEQPYSRLIPLARPRDGQQYAFEVELDKCSGCKACVTACHSLNGLEESETWRSVGLLVGGAPSVQQHVTTACHHCVDPGCLSGCPVLAYEKDPLTGIVRHLDDQCIGCQYCIMKCPYEVPQYSSRLGIVRKCDMCYHRLAVGEAPACVQACPSEAIRITVVDQASIRAKFRPVPRQNYSLRGSDNPARLKDDHISADSEDCTFNHFLPDSPDPSLTIPTTRFVSKSSSSTDLNAADHGALKLEPPHWPLIWMLILTQAAAGLFIAAACSRELTNTSPAIFTAAVLLVIGLIAATLHLGRPLRAWRAFLGWRTSWLSRELIALNVLAATSLLTIASRALPALCDCLTVCDGILGVVSVFASAMVYVDTGRPAWSARIAFGNFFGTMLLLGAVCASLLLFATRRSELAVLFFEAAFVIRTTLFVWRRLQLRSASDFKSTIHWNARAVHELLPRTVRADVALFVLSTAAAAVVILDIGDNRLLWLSVAAATMFAAEIIARYVFFAASGSKRMPGGILA
jgi:formate dehydrogenase iron-sulfur subunit